jgi:Arc/MetJ family transcription regulator
MIAIVVYLWYMTRTNIDIDDDLVGEVMRRHDVRTKREALDLALRRLVGVPLTRDFLLDLRGLGWGGDLDELRSADPVEGGRTV